MSFDKKINHQILNDLPFALIKFPKEKEFYLIRNNKDGENIYCFHSFDNSKEYKFNFIEYEELSEKVLYSDIPLPLLKNNKKKTISKVEYLELLKNCIFYLQNNTKYTDKIVISRTQWIEKSINPFILFLSLTKKYSNSFCHLSYWNNEECWIGATPEVLGIYENSIFHTMSLAGTLPDDRNYEWKDKEYKEQSLVTEYINEKLKKYSTNISIKGPTTLHLPPIKHLVTHFKAKIPNNSSITKLISELHPTPAVCGLPLENSLKFINENEGYDREFYTGYIGIETKDSYKYFVNLRCGKISKNGILLFVGGGITSQSIPEKEWKETKLKSKFIEDNI